MKKTFIAMLLTVSSNVFAYTQDYYDSIDNGDTVGGSNGIGGMIFLAIVGLIVIANFIAGDRYKRIGMLKGIAGTVLLFGYPLVFILYIGKLLFGAIGLFGYVLAFVMLVATLPSFVKFLSKLGEFIGGEKKDSPSERPPIPEEVEVKPVRKRRKKAEDG